MHKLQLQARGQLELSPHKQRTPAACRSTAAVLELRRLSHVDVRIDGTVAEYALWHTGRVTLGPRPQALARPCAEISRVET